MQWRQCWERGDERVQSGLSGRLGAWMKGAGPPQGRRWKARGELRKGRVGGAGKRNEAVQCDGRPRASRARWAYQAQARAQGRVSRRAGRQERIENRQQIASHASGRRGG
jgi:hypothetical protein